MADVSDRCFIKKFDDELQVFWAEVYIPDIPDSQGDFMTAPDIRKMQMEHMMRGDIHKIDVQHDNAEYGTFSVESFIARPDDPTFIEGAWVQGIHVQDPVLWKQIKDGELNGLSMQAAAVRTATVLEMNLPSVVVGKTDETDDHWHQFSVRFSEDGVFLGGKAEAGDNDHEHNIGRGTITEVVKGHSHRYFLMDELANAQIAA